MTTATFLFPPSTARRMRQDLDRVGPPFFTMESIYRQKSRPHFTRWHGEVLSSAVLRGFPRFTNFHPLAAMIAREPRPGRILPTPPPKPFGSIAGMGSM